MIRGNRVWLVNSQHEYTQHEYVRTEDAELGAGPRPVRGLAHIFKCTQTGVERRYGFDQNSSLPYEDDEELS